MGFLQVQTTSPTNAGHNYLGVPDIIHPEGNAMNESALQTYRQVADLVQKGQLDQARGLAATIPVDHLRGLALLLVNCSRRL
jgi:hypothetical protein